MGNAVRLCGHRIGPIVLAAGCTLEPAGFAGRFDAPPGLGPVDEDESSDGGVDESGLASSSGVGGSSDSGAGESSGEDETTAGLDAGDEGSTGSDDVTSSDPQGSGDAEGSSSGGAGTDAGDQPRSGMWAPCTSVTQCETGMGCLTNEAHTDGFCSVLCTPAGDPSACGPAPGSAPIVCHVAGAGESVCALDCALGQTCPNGMACTDTDVCM